MILSKRERYVAILTTAVVGILALDYYILSPLFAQRSELQAAIKKEHGELDRASKLLNGRRAMSQKWNDMAKAGLKTDASTSETAVLHAVRDWATASKLNLASLKPEKTEQEKAFQRITFRATATGTLETIGQFLWRIHMATIPVRISDVQIGSRKEGSDDLSLQIGISTVYYAPELEKPEKPAKGAAAREARE